VKRVDIPPGLAKQARLGPDWADWLDRLPRMTADVLDEWQLTVDGPPMYGFCSLVIPVRTEGVWGRSGPPEGVGSSPDSASGTPAVLKVTFDGDDESEHEGLALQHWAGRGTVQLLRADPKRNALLLERLHTDDLTGVWDIEACEIVAGFYPSIHLPALPQLRTITSYVDRWLRSLARLRRDAPIPHRLVEQTLSLGRDLVADPASVGRIIHGDLHYENVLAADRAPWLVIDPKPMSGDPHYEPAPMLWNRWEEMVAAGDLRGSIRRRFHTLVDAADLDEQRARDWVVVRMILNANWAIEDAERMSRALDEEEREWITRCITLAKAVQD
jgi:streptomycin 6-kinase